MSDPKRWLDDPGELGRLGEELLSAGARLAPPGGALDRACAEFFTLHGPTLASIAGTSSPSGATLAGGAALAQSGTSLGAFALVKSFVLGAALGTGAVAGAVGVGRGELFSGAETRPSVTSQAAPLAGKPPRADSHPTQAQEDALPPEPARAPAPAVRSARARHARSGARPLPTSTAEESKAEFATGRTASELRAEAEMLSRAKDLIARGQPADGLSTLDQAARRFPNGALAQEREVLLIEALVRSGNTEMGRERAQTFIDRFPRSPFTDRVRKIAGL